MLCRPHYRTAFPLTGAVLLVTAVLWPRAEAIAQTAADVSLELELSDPVQPDQAVSTIVVEDGFRVELVAAEPLVHDPIAMEFDENGFAYVIEVPPYNEHGKPGQKSVSTIARLEDTDGDGRFDQRVTFAELKYPTGLCCYEGGLFVGDPPDLLYLRDTDGDGRADQRDVVLTGFGAAPAGESQLNSFRWGLDNRIHISTGLDGGEVRVVEPGPSACSTAGADQQPRESVAKASGPPPARDVRNRRVLLEPRSRSFELTSGGGQYGMSFDDWGRTYVCDNSRPVQLIMYDDRYIERNPLMSAPSAVVTLGPGANFTRLARISPPESWRRIRTRLRNEGREVDDTFEPGRDSGAFTSATGVTIYRGDAWPAEYRGNAFVGEVANNLVYRVLLKSEGLSTRSERAGGDAEFLASCDTWFRPANFCQGPDGNLYVLDMYRQLIEGVQWVPAQVLALMDVTAGSDRGRIYRIVPAKFKPRASQRLGELSSLELVAQLEHPNGWHRDTASRLLYERQDTAALEPLRRLARESRTPLGRLHALCALDGVNALQADDLLGGLADEHPRVREHAIRLSESLDAKTTELQQKLVSLAADPDPAVRLQLAFTAGHLPAAERHAVLLALLRSDGADPWFRMAIQSSLAEGAPEFVRPVLVDNDLADSSQAAELLAALAWQIGRSKRSDEIRAVVAALDQLDAPAERSGAVAKTMIRSLLAEGSGATTAQLIESSTGLVRATVVELLTTSRATASDQDAALELRIEAITLLGCGDFATERATLADLLDPRQPQPVQEAALQVLGRFSDGEVVALILAKWPTLTPTLRSAAAEVLFSRPAWTDLLLTAIEQQTISPADFDPGRVALLQSHASEPIRERATRLFGSTNLARRGEVVDRYQQALHLAGDAQRGGGVFEKSCAACHELNGKGTAIGADLKSIRDRGKDAVLLNILDPNREVLPSFLTYMVTISDGRTITGIITEETPNNLTVRQADGTAIAIARVDIEAIESTGLSYMPEGLETQIDEQAMADLLAYLMGEDERAASGE